MLRQRAHNPASDPGFETLVPYLLIEKADSHTGRRLGHRAEKTQIPGKDARGVVSVSLIRSTFDAIRGLFSLVGPTACVLKSKTLVGDIASSSGLDLRKGP